MRSEEKKSVLTVNLAVFLSGFSSILSRWTGVSALGVTFGRVLFSSLALLLYLLLTKQSLRLRSGKDAGLLFLTGAVLALHWWCFFESVRVSTVAIGTITYSSFPLFVTLLEPLLFHTRLRRRDVACALLILLGVVITLPGLHMESAMVRGAAIGMVSALAYACLTLSNRFLAGRYPGSVITFCEQAAAGVLLFPFVLASGVRPTGKDVLILAVMGVFTTALTHTLYNNGLRFLPARLAGILASMEPVYGILLALLLLGEVPSVREILGGLIILATVVFSQLEFGKRAR